MEHMQTDEPLDHQPPSTTSPHHHQHMTPAGTTSPHHHQHMATARAETVHVGASHTDTYVSYTKDTGKTNDF